MKIGSNIKTFRIKKGYTQKELADVLHVTYQAVSKWENDDSEPSFDMLKKICNILNCSLEDLFYSDDEQHFNNRYNHNKQMLALCEKCNTPIYESNDINRITDTIKVGNGKFRKTELKERIICNNCYNKIKDEEEQIRLTNESNLKEKIKRRRRIHSFIWPTLLFVIFLVVGIINFKSGHNQEGLSSVLTSIFVYTLVGTLILNNTFLAKLWEEISMWGFVKMPGVIFSLDFDGLKFLIWIKVLFFILEILLAILAVILATYVCLIVSIFVYPLSLYRNLKYIA